MFKKIALSIFSFFMLLNIQAQQMDGEFAPNFTGTDLEGNSWTLYEILDQGKSVIMDISATWCGPCWDYHLTHTLDDYYNQFGPSGTDEVVVFLIEGDAGTNIDCLYGNSDCNGGSLGNWVEGTTYPIIDDANIAELYQVDAFPTIYHICPNRIISYADRLSVDEMYNLHNACPQPSGENNLSVLEYFGDQGTFCGTSSIKPQVTLQNLGTSLITSAKIDLYINNEKTETVNWTGEVLTYGTTDISFTEFTLENNSEIEIIVDLVNGASNESTSDESVKVFANIANTTSENILTLEFAPFGFFGGYETYWEILDENQNILYTGGNANAVGSNDNSGTYLDTDDVSVEFAVPNDGCYEIVLYEIFGDGFENVAYTLYGPLGEVILTGPSELADINIDRNQFSVEGAMELNNNVTIISYSGEKGHFCTAESINSKITVQNLGANVITSMVVEVSDQNGTILNSQVWTGSINPQSFGIVDLTEIEILEGAIISYTIVQVNESEDSHDYNNTLNVEHLNVVSNDEFVNLEIQFDLYADSESSWVFLNSDGEEIAAGQGISQGLFNTTLDFTPNINDCYELKLLDSYADGIQDFGFTETYLKITDSQENELVYINLDGFAFEEHSIFIEANLNSSKNIEAKQIQSISLFPNPANEYLSVDFNLSETTDLKISINNCVGQVVQDLSYNNYTLGDHRLNLDINELPSGIYFLNFSNLERTFSYKFVVND